MILGHKRKKIDVFINFGNDNILHKEFLAKPGISALDALAEVADIEFTGDESATGHDGAVVTAINGFKVDISHFWMYYIFDKNKAGWAIPMCTPDLFRVTGNTRIAWRYHIANNPKEMQRYGPLSTKSCISKIKRCNRQF
ncbi:Uncharacterised protein [uncultured archaeon]|nr:Uncharacterised protein [uncultured archaeon]